MRLTPGAATAIWRSSLLAVALLPAVALAQAPVTRDSSGISIITNVRPALPAARAWRVDTRPLLEIGATGTAAAGDSLYEFSLVMGVARLSDGRLAVGVQGSHVVRFYDARGRFTGSAGRRGEGPGEFQQILGLVNTPGDTLVVTDLGEVEFFTGDGRFIAQGASRRTQPGGFIWPNAVLSDRSYVGIDWNDRTIPPAGRGERRAAMVHVSADGSQADTLGQFLLQTGRFDGRTPFANEPIFAPRRLLASDGQRLFTGYPERYEITELTPAGKVIRLIRREVRPVAVPAASREAYRRHMLSQPGEGGQPLTPAQRTHFERFLEEGGFAESAPAYGMLLADRAGYLWVRHFDPRERMYTTGPSRVLTIPALTTWDVFDRRGHWVTTLTLPSHFTPLEIGADYVAGVARDADDVESVRVHRLIKP